MLRLDHQISKVKDEELAKIDPEKEEWMKSEDYTKLQEKLAKDHDEDEYKNDTDPQGFELYRQVLEGKSDFIWKFVDLVTSKNTDVNLHAKALPYFIKQGKMMKALKSVILLNEKHAGHPKTIPTTAKFLKSWFEMDAEARTTASGGKIFIDVIEKEVAQLGGPKTAKDLPKWVAGKQKEAVDPMNRSLEACHENIKLSLNTLNNVDKNAEKLAT